MQQRAVVGEEEDAGRVLVEPPDRLHAARSQRRGQQRIDARMTAGLLRALVAGRLVKHDQRALPVRPALAAADPEPEAVGIELASGIGDDADAFDLEQAVRDQRGALAARAEALGEEQVGGLHRAPESRPPGDAVAAFTFNT